MSTYDPDMHYPEHHEATGAEQNAMAKGHAHQPHALPLWILLGTFVILGILTWLTVAITNYDFGYEVNLIVALAIAVVKAAFVLLYFMHLRYDAPLNGFIIVAALFFVSLFISFTLIDTSEYADNYDPPTQAIQSP